MGDCRCEAPTEIKESVEYRILAKLGFFGHFLRVYVGGRSGKQRLLIRLLESEGGLSQRELQDCVPVSSATLSETLAKLEGEGLIERTRSDHDRRQLNISLTASGRVEAGRCHDQRAAFVRRSLSPLSQAEKDSLLDMLDRLEKHWIEMEKEGRAMQQ